MGSWTRLLGDAVITYAHLVIWVWTVALVATLVVLGMAWRAIARADAAVVALHGATEGLRATGSGTASLAEEVATSRAHRSALVERAEVLADQPS